MRAHYLIAATAVFIIGLGATQFFFPPTKAEADLNVIPSIRMNVLQMQSEMDMKNLPEQKMHDMTFVFDSN
jgi:hypothetical protein